jgi:hypothetical protein
VSAPDVRRAVYNVRLVTTFSDRFGDANRRSSISVKSEVSPVAGQQGRSFGRLIVAMRTAFSQVELQGYSEIVSYDFEALYRAAAALKRGAEAPDSVEQRWDQNFRLEAFAIHCRLLERFFFDKSPRPTDVVATDFQLKNWSPVCTPALREACEKAGKHVAHITIQRNGLNRSPAKESRWPVFVCLHDVCDLMEQFLRAVPLANLKPGIDQVFATISRLSQGLVYDSGTVGTGGTATTSLIQQGSAIVTAAPKLGQSAQFKPCEQGQEMTVPTPIPPADLTTT